jgi:glycosyltransferase involved in cell wall biosynthesis
LDYRCIIVGEGELQQDLKKQINSLGLQEKCFLPGPFSQEMLIENIYSSADILVAPCRTAPDGDRDGIPNVILESMCMKIPVVATPIAGIPEVVIDQKTGLLISEESETQLAQAILFLHRDKKTAECLGQAGANLIKTKFDRNKNINQLIDLFNRVKE